MGSIGTFDGFTTARLGIYAAQHGLNVTGNNISNLNTIGYTRQRIDQVSWKTGGNDMYRSPYDVHMGSGAMVTSVNQIRDPYLDIQYRTVSSKVGYTDTWLSGIKNITQTLDEVGKGDASNTNDKGDGILYAQLLEIQRMLMQLHNNPDKANDTLVRKSAETLCQLFNTYAGKLETERKDLDKQFTEELSSVNEILTSIRDLNDSIRKAEICGDNALELRDERNLKIDALSQYMHIKVEYTMEDVGAGKQVEKLTISLGNANPDADVHTDETVLIDGIYGAQFRIKQVPKENPNYDPNQPFSPTNLMYLDENDQPCKLADAAMVNDPHYTMEVTNLVDSKNVLPKNHNEITAGRPITLADNDLYGSFQAMRELLTEKGEFATQADVDADPNATIKRGFPYYQMSLDLLARQFAQVYNELNQGVLLDEEGNELQSLTGTIEELESYGVKLNQAEGTAGGFGDGYYVKDGIFVGTSVHDPCDLNEAQISVDDTVDEAIAKIRDKVDPNFGKNPDGSEASDADKLASLKDFMSQHGVNSNNVDTEKITLPGPIEVGGPLFSNGNYGDDVENITASNISVSHSWSIGDVKVIPKFKVLFDGDVEDTTQNTNIDHMISKIEEALVYNPQDLDPDALSTKLFKGSFNDMFNDMGTTLGGDERIHTTNLNTHYSQAVDIDTRRDGVSGVDLNDEAMNIMMYQKAYSAACRMMTAIDEALDRLINNTGLAGL
mgnify:FL=1